MNGSISKARLLIVEDDYDISNMLKIYFTGQGLTWILPLVGQMHL